MNDAAWEKRYKGKFDKQILKSNKNTELREYWISIGLIKP